MTTNEGPGTATPPLAVEAAGTVLGIEPHDGEDVHCCELPDGRWPEEFEQAFTDGGWTVVDIEYDADEEAEGHRQGATVVFLVATTTVNERRSRDDYS